jgi:[citrate (pro-3S)-lyase] ligase
VQCLLDIEVFAKHYAPHFGITCRFVGTEPLSPMTCRYNEALKAHLPELGIAVSEIPRLETEGAPISATAVRQALDEGKDFRHLVPDTTYEYLMQGGFCHA